MASSKGATVLYLGGNQELLTPEIPHPIAGRHVHTLTVQSVEEAIELCRQVSPNLILVGLANHAEAIAACRAIRRISDRPLLMLTENAGEEKLLEGYAAGADECIPRPVSRNLLSAKIVAWLRWSSPSASPDHNST